MSNILSLFMNLPLPLLTFFKVVWNSDNLRVKCGQNSNFLILPRPQAPCWFFLGGGFISRAHLFNKYIEWHSERLEFQISTMTTQSVLILLRSER